VDSVFKANVASGWFSGESFHWCQCFVDELEENSEFKTTKYQKETSEFTTSGKKET
jgi:hypothetical protein